MTSSKETWKNGILTVRAEECLACSDVHAPGESKLWINRLIEYAIANKIKTLFIIGDFWNNDSVSKWERKDPTMNLKKELEHGVVLLKKLTKHMRVYLLCGNHDERMPKVLKYALSFSEWMQNIYSHNIVVTDFDYMYMQSGNKKFRLCHPNMYSRIKGNISSNLAQDKHENVIVGHSHFLSLSTNKTGKYLCIDSGCMCDPNLFLYKNASTSRCPDWENGFIHIKSGKVKLISDNTF